LLAKEARETTITAEAAETRRDAAEISERTRRDCLRVPSWFRDEFLTTNLAD
jgi:hypothetical protein